MDGRQQSTGIILQETQARIPVKAPVLDRTAENAHSPEPWARSMLYSLLRRKMYHKYTGR